MLDIGSIDPFSVVKANALSILPGKYGRKAKTQRNRRGLAQAVDHVVQFDDKRGTLPGLDIPTSYSPEREEIRKKVGTGAAWLSSARTVKRSLKWGNERNPYPVLLCHGKLPLPKPAGLWEIRSTKPLNPKSIKNVSNFPQKTDLSLT